MKLDQDLRILLLNHRHELWRSCRAFGCKAGPGWEMEHKPGCTRQQVLADIAKALGTA